MKKLLAFVLAAVMLCSCFTAVSAEGARTAASFLYVAEDGSDSADGKFDTPFATLEKAVQAAREIDGTTVISIRGGEYALTDTLALTSVDNNLVIRAMPGEKVSFTGGHKINYSDFTAETDKELLSKIILGSARSNVLTADLKALGIEDLGEIQSCGFSMNSAYAPTLTYNDRYLTIAQYPNGKDYIYTSEIKDSESDKERSENGGYEVKYTVKDSRYKNWAEAEDVWAIGWYKYDWAESITPASVDVDTGVITAYSGYRPILPDRRVKFFNLFEELDTAGEYYINRDTGKLYMIAPEGFKNGDYLVFSSFDKDIVTLNECENIIIQGIRFEGTTERGIYGSKCKNCVVDACELTAIGRGAVTFENDSRECVIKNCYIHDVGSSGAKISGGDKAALTKSNNVITNCHIERFMQYRLTYTPAVQMTGVGNTVSHCEINDGPHEGAAYTGVYNVFEYNEVYRVCTDSSDAGAIYTGRNWADRNNEIRYNYFHDLEMIDTTAGMEMQAVYLDDMHSCTFVYGNVFYKCDSVALYGGGRDNTFENNLMLECKKPFVFDARGTDWMETGEGSTIYNNLVNSPWQTDVWKKAFPEMQDILTNNPKYPMKNTIRNNLIYNTPSMDIHELVKENGVVEDPITVKRSDFVDYGKNFALKSDSEVYTKLPEFKNIPFDDIGRTEYIIEDNYVEKTLNDNVKVVLNGKEIEFDVEPQIINDRTMVPLRAIFEALEAEVSWDGDSKTITATRGSVTVRMTIGEASFTRNSETISLDSPAVIVDSRTLVPVRAIAESFGSTVEWDGSTKTVIITE